ncbi:hypothetical protein MKX03_008191 [Papaver bracteatum]|nr:hypothetical protein MKX03_008191 [Papaver bracteatum]
MIETNFQGRDDGLSIRIPFMFVDKAEPEDYNGGMPCNVVSVLTRATNSLKITFLEAKDISDLGSLETVARIFVPGKSTLSVLWGTLYSARIIKIKEEEGISTQHFAVVVAARGGKAYIAGASAPESRWEEDGVTHRSAAISLSLL